MKLTIPQQLQDYLTSLGVDIQSLLEQEAIPNKLWQEEITLTPLEYYRLLTAFDRTLSEPAIRALSQLAHIQLFVPAFFAALSAPHGVEALERFARFKQLVGPIEVTVVVTDHTVSVSFSFVHAQMALPKFAVLNEQLLVLDLLRTGTGKAIQPLLVESPYVYDPETVAVFGLPVQQMETNRLVFDRRDVERRFVTRNNIMWRYLEPELNQHLAQQGRAERFAVFVQQALYAALPTGDFAAASIAHRLGVSARTLQRNLAAENTTFKQELQAVQKAMTFSYLKLNLATEEIAHLVGYSEVAALSRAFKKWTGQTLSDYRQQLT